MKKQYRCLLMVLGLAVFYLVASMFAQPVAAAPEVPGAPVDLVAVETYYGGYGVPGDPGQNLSAWIEVQNLTTQNQFILTQIYESQSDTTIVERAVWVNAGATSVWFPTWLFKNYPDAVRARLWYWNYGTNSWAFADKAIGWLQADQFLQGNPGHWPWTPNMYRQLRRWSSPDPNYHWVETRFWYFDNNVTGIQNGTDRYNRMRTVTNANWGNFGRFQVEYRRTTTADITSPSQEGWDAVYAQGIPPFCQNIPYGTDTNLPSYDRADEEMQGDCSPLDNDEEAEVTTTATEQMSVYVGRDPTNVHLQQSAPIYRFAVKFYRRPLNQGQSFHLHTKFEMLDDVLADTNGFDIEIPIRYSGWTY